MIRFLILFFMCMSLLHAEDIYVAQSSAGANDGTSAGNAKALSWLNDAANWGSGANKVSPADTVHLCGTFTSSLIVPADGSAGNQVEVLFEAGANFTSPIWSPDGAIQLQNRSYITINGGTNGLIRNTDNGDSLGHQADSAGISNYNGSNGGPVDNIIIKNLTISNIFVRTLDTFTAYGWCVKLASP